MSFAFAGHDGVAFAYYAFADYAFAVYAGNVDDSRSGVIGGYRLLWITMWASVLGFIMQVLQEILSQVLPLIIHTAYIIGHCVECF